MEFINGTMKIVKKNDDISDYYNNIVDYYKKQFFYFAAKLLLNLNNQSYIISFNNYNEFDKKVNTMKSRCFQFMFYIIRYYKDTLTQDDEISKVFLNVLFEGLKTLEFIVKDKLVHTQNLDENEYPDYGYTSFICSLMDYILIVLTLDFVIVQYSNNIKTFAINILFPLLITGAKEKTLMKKDGRDFHNIIFDITTKFQVWSIKTKAGKLIKVFSDKYTGLGEFIINFYLQLLDYIISSQSGQVNLEDYNLLQLNSPYEVISKLSSEKIIEATLLVFNILTQTVLKQNITPLFTLIFQRNLPKLYLIQDDLVKEKICLLLGNFIDNIYLYDKNAKEFQQGVEFLFECLFQFNNNQGLSYQAANSIKDLIYVKKYSNIFNNVLSKCFSDIALSIKENENTIFFDVLLEIVLFIDNTDYTLEICKEITLRILKEIKTPSRKNLNLDFEYNDYINKCFNVLKAVTENKTICNTYYEKFDLIFDSLFEYMKNPSRIDFEDDIIDLTYNMITNTNKITESAKKIFPTLSKCIGKNNLFSKQLFLLINQYIIIDNQSGNTLFSNFLYQKTLVDIYKVTLPLSHYPSLIRGSCILQIALQSLNCLNKEFVDAFISLTVHNLEAITIKISNFDSNEKLEFFDSIDFDILSNYISVFYSSMIHYCEITVAKCLTILPFNILKSWTNQVLIGRKRYSSFIGRSIIFGLICLIRFIYTKQDKTLMNEFPELITLLFNFLERQRLFEKDKLNYKLKKYINPDFIDEDEEDEEINDDDTNEDKIEKYEKKYIKILKAEEENKIYGDFEFENEEEIEDELVIKKIYKDLISPINTADEYKIFTELIEEISKNNINLLIDWEITLTVDEKEKFKELLGIRRIELDKLENKKLEKGSDVTEVTNSNLFISLGTVPRRIIKIKRNNDINN